jgi:hypothetical protein
VGVADVFPGHRDLSAEVTVLGHGTSPPTGRVSALKNGASYNREFRVPSRDSAQTRRARAAPETDNAKQPAMALNLDGTKTFCYFSLQPK